MDQTTVICRSVVLFLLVPECTYYARTCTRAWLTCGSLIFSLNEEKKIFAVCIIQLKFIYTFFVHLKIGHLSVCHARETMKTNTDQFSFWHLRWHDLFTTSTRALSNMKKKTFHLKILGSCQIATIHCMIVAQWIFSSLFNYCRWDDKLTWKGSYTFFSSMETSLCFL